MKFLIVLPVLLIVFGVYKAMDPIHEKNHLSNEKSPYLQQHANNPIWWYPWGDEAFKKAKELDIPIFLSVGYSTCHWCHVMEKQSFEKQEVADVLNPNYISIKVDREERPDVDSIYMDALQAMNGSGGWPMTLIMTPDRKPFFAATYIAKNSLIKLLHRVSQGWNTEREKIEKSGQELVDWLQKDRFEHAAGLLNEDTLRAFYKIFFSQYDRTHGGRLGAPKFPPSFEMRSLLRVFRRTQDITALDAVKLTLNKMARGGIYDHLLGGFHRYSTDQKWLVPHFEKMLYDQAALAKIYSEAFQVTGNKEYGLVVREILDYILKDMTHPEGGFFSAEDADSEGKEGKFCVWNWKELQRALTDDELSELVNFYGVREGGQFEGDNILHLQGEKNRWQRSKVLLSALDKLKNIRKKRVQAFKDEKVLTSWNGLMISAMATAGRILNDRKYIDAAKKAADFILKYNVDRKKLLRLSLNKSAQSPAQLDDYSAMIDALIEVYQTSFDEKYLLKAQDLQLLQDKTFSDKKSATYYSTDGQDQNLIVRQREFYDRVVPSGNSMSLYNLLRLSQYFPEGPYKERALRFFKEFPDVIAKQPIGYGFMLLSVDWILSKPQLLVFAGKKNEVEKIFSDISQEFHPHLLVAWSENSKLQVVKGKVPIRGRDSGEEQLSFYLCTEGRCDFPISDINQLKQRLGRVR